MNPAVSLGLECCLDPLARLIAGGRFGLLMNQASVDREFRYACDVLAAALPGQLAAIFSPQHGLFSEQQANMIESPHARHPEFGVPVYSLYSETRRPTLEMLRGLDAFVVDLQDVGTRVYTFIWTISHCLEACAAAGIPVMILDRPNPVGGEIVEGPLLDPNFRTFVGRAEIPLRHGLTLAELARLVNDELHIGADLHTVSMQGWRRRMSFEETGRVWLPPSPNLPRVEGVRLYPGQVLLEGTNLSEGRGTTTPFELIGAPFIDPRKLFDAVAEYDLQGVAFRPLRFVPMFDKWSGQSCGGLSLHITDLTGFRPVQTTIALIAAIQRLWPNEFHWLPPPYEYETVKMPFDIIVGNASVRETIEAVRCRTSADVVALTSFDATAWLARCEKYRMYEN